jgi:hypothetical protein
MSRYPLTIGFPELLRMSSRQRLAFIAIAAAALGAVASQSVRAESFASSASSAGSASVGSLSDSVKGSSNSSTGGNKTAEGAYRVDAVALVDGQPDQLRLTLKPLAPQAGHADTVQVDLPRRALGDQALAAGDRVQVTQRTWGLEFARAENREPFFLALADAWRDGMAARPVGR